ncbi:MAG: chaperone modulator CbpM [Bacteroidales bacterium]|jgi:hypothetical protein|nr:chaperone modulator CbpM [Bacteroidales bacterium]
MQTDLIIASEYCQEFHVESSFIELLADEGLIELQIVEGVSYILTDQIPDLNRYVRWHYDLSINIEGIDTIRHLLLKMDEMQLEISRLRQQLALLGTPDSRIENW